MSASAGRCCCGVGVRLRAVLVALGTWAVLVGCTFDLAEVQAVPGDGGAFSDVVSDGSAEAAEAAADAGEAAAWPETSPGGCDSKQDCDAGQFCNEGVCEACTPDWTPTGGGNHCGEDWKPEDGSSVAGYHVHVGVFEVAAGSTVNVEPWNGTDHGELSVHARVVRVDGTLSAEGAGAAGGEPGAGGDPSGAGHAGKVGVGDYGGTPGGGGDGRGSGCNGKDKEPHAPGWPGQVGAPGGYSAPGSNADTCQTPVVRRGSAGGGGGGAGGGERSTCCDLNVSGGRGGGGGRGGNGGGLVSLVASELVAVSGHLRTTGQAGGVGQAGQEGDSEWSQDSGAGCDACGSCADHRYAYCPGMGPCGSAQNDCCQRECCYIYEGGPGGDGGRGGNGAGGGVLIEAPTVTLSGFVDALGGQNTPDNGGTVVIRHQGEPPSVSDVAGGVLCVESF